MKKTITLEELKKMPPISEERLKEIEEFKEDFSDPEIPPMTEEELKEMRLMREVHPDWYKVRKKTITIRLDIDVIERYKSFGKGYQSRINSDLRKILGLDR